MADAGFSSPEVAVALGANLGDPVATLCRTRPALEGVLRARRGANLRWSRLWRTQPLGPPQPDYVNAVLVFTPGPDLTPEDLLDLLQAQERAEGRLRRERWGPRTLDLDILFFGAHHQQTPRLTLPHPEAQARGFVLWPLLDAWPQAVLPGWGAVRTLAERCGRGGVEPLADPPGWR